MNYINEYTRTKILSIFCILLLVKAPQSLNIDHMDLYKHVFLCFFPEFPHLIMVLLETSRLTIIITGWTEFRGGGGLCVFVGGWGSLGILNAQKSQWGRGSDIRVPLSLKSGPLGVINLQ